MYANAPVGKSGWRMRTNGEEPRPQAAGALLVNEARGEEGWGTQ